MLGTVPVGKATWEPVHPEVGAAPFPWWFWGNQRGSFPPTGGWQGAERPRGQEPSRDTSRQGRWEGVSGNPGGLAGLQSTPVPRGSTWVLPEAGQLCSIKHNDAVPAPPPSAQTCLQEEMPRPAAAPWPSFLWHCPNPNPATSGWPRAACGDHASPSPLLQGHKWGPQTHRTSISA